MRTVSQSVRRWQEPRFRLWKCALPLTHLILRRRARRALHSMAAAGFTLAAATAAVAVVGLVIEIVWAIDDAVTVHVVVLMGWVAVVIVILAGGAVVVAAVGICFPAVCQHSWREQEQKRKQKCKQSFPQGNHLQEGTYHESEKMYRKRRKARWSESTRSARP